MYIYIYNNNNNNNSNDNKPYRNNNDNKKDSNKINNTHDDNSSNSNNILDLFPVVSRSQSQPVRSLRSSSMEEAPVVDGALNGAASSGSSNMVCWKMDIEMDNLWIIYMDNLYRYTIYMDKDFPESHV